MKYGLMDRTETLFQLSGSVSGVDADGNAWG